MNNKQEKLANKCDCCNKAPCACPPNCSCGCKNKTAASKPGLWANIHAKKQRGEAPAKPGDKDYPDAKNWKKVTQESEKKAAPAWQTSEGKSESGGLNDKGRASLKAQGHDIKRPQPEGGPRKDSFCARMKGMKAKLTSEETARDPDSRINKALRKWKCGSAEKLASLLKQSRCWEGYEAVPGKKPYSEDSCRPVGSASKPQKKKEPEMTRKQAAAIKKANAITNLLNRLRPYLPTRRQAAIGAGTTAGVGTGLYLGGKAVGAMKEKLGDLTSAGGRIIDDLKNIPGKATEFAKEQANLGSSGWSMDPTLANALVGGGGGALLGAGVGALSPRDKRKSRLSHILSYSGLGALGGAGLGAGVTEGSRYLGTRPGSDSDGFIERMAKDVIHNLPRKQQFGLASATGNPIINNPATNFVQGLGLSAGLQY